MPTQLSSVDKSHVNYAPGMRVEVRDAEWRIRAVDYATDGGYVVTCEGLSQLVQGREAQFLSKLDSITILDPVTTQLVDDTSSNFKASKLYIDSMLRKTAPSNEKIHLGHRAAIDQLPFQLEPALQALEQPRQRILIADAVGLGKTLEAGILTSELIARGRGKRILVLAVKSMLTQFQQEFWNRFTIPLVRLDSVGLQRVRNKIPANHNPFHYFDRSIISIDTLKQDIEYRHYLEQAYWDIIIIDEAHNVAERTGGSQRSKLAKLLSTRSDTLIMLSATPHDGKAESFASLMNMLDPTAIANPSDYSNEDFKDKGLVIRRFKKDVRDQLKGNFPEREIKTVKTTASKTEETAFDSLMDVTFQNLDGRSQGAGHLFRTTLEKALFSSPAACLSTVQKRMAALEKRIQKEQDSEKQSTLIDDYGTLQGLELALKAITPAEFSKFQLLIKVINEDFNWTPKVADDRLVIFTESVKTLEFLNEQLPKALKLKSKQYQILHGGMRDKDIMDIVESFNRQESDLRLLICSDVASEGINLHHMSHRMIHFDIPWSLMVFQQRNGRIDRYGQTKQPQIRYLLTQSEHEKVRGDQRILEILIDKDEQASKNIGDPSEFLGTQNIDEEAEKVAAAIEDESTPDIAGAFEAMMNGQLEASENPLAQFIPSRDWTAETDSVSALPRVFSDGISYCKTAIDWFAETEQKVDARVTNDIVQITAPADLRARLNYLPQEVRPDNDHFMLTNDIDKISEEIKRCRQEDEAKWPSLQYLWPVHPVMEWLSDKALNAFGRHTAPVLRIPAKLAADEHIVLVHGGFPNRRGHVLIQDWVAVLIKAGNVSEILNWEQLNERVGLSTEQLPNSGDAYATDELQKLLPASVKAAKEQLKHLKQQYQQRKQAYISDLENRLEQLKGKHERQLELEFAQSDAPDALKERRKTEKQSQIDRVFRDYQDWINNTQHTEDQPYLQVVAVFTGSQG